ncbi:[FeFe] hydrogenase, group A [Clostridium autoethanogenum]|uniref:4Fe-4S dicluster domain-containing protein n=2 Tax=Clostridium autoethanogenum TaxID=84023 RepID=A0A3M0S3Q3_9CLOT|nr:[FeFe] hydrogenase, group A [Clostridium autoethanogenum]AGY75799.1 [FeFe] hydrogenase, group A [Clostridium autoethanogenum DSM 10061]ALU35964.1 Hydrogenase Fe-only [Clostridium autoethanogenum DSM 10061]OVY51978.1 NADP-reducing hydrogenase subunit HndC [Clostridium autoethanogenum]RMC93079.1 4Fe-4S dicluster domain-containing protein [Clostridium autoethanogenum]
MSGQFMIIDNIPVEINGEKNILELIRKAGIDLPTFCYHSELSVYGACRMCMVEDKRGRMQAACSTPPQAGIEIYTNTPRLRKYRKNILELLLANHCRDCTTCEKNEHCKLQDLAKRFKIKKVRFKNTSINKKIDNSSVCIVRNRSKCILCGDCVRVCEEVQNVGAIDFVKRGSNMTVTTAFDEPIANSNCVGCGQCAAVCPTGAIVVKDDTAELWEALSDKNTKVVAQIAPAVRVGLNEELGEENGENEMGKIVAALRRMGFDEVFDTSTAADLTVLEETAEFTSRLEKNESLPLFTSCCSAWVNYVENTHPELMKYVSTCKSPMEMFASVLKEYYKNSDKKIVVVAVMPCTAKKYEAKREEFSKNGVPDVDYVITTQELISMIRQAGIVFPELEPEAVDMPFDLSSGAGVIFGVTGGVTEAVIRKVLADKSNAALRAIVFNGVRGMEGTKEASITVGDREIKIAIVSGLRNAENLIQKIQSGESKYDFVEVMACPGGCISGGGQPFEKLEGKLKRSAGIYQSDKMSTIKRTADNPLMKSLYSGLLKGKNHELLHVNRK